LQQEAARRGISPDALVAQLVVELPRHRTSDADPSGAAPQGANEFFGFLPFPHRGGRVTNAAIDALRDELAV
jgi:hypothetical protein